MKSSASEPGLRVTLTEKGKRQIQVENFPQNGK